MKDYPDECPWCGADATPCDDICMHSWRLGFTVVPPGSCTADWCWHCGRTYRDMMPRNNVGCRHFPRQFTDDEGWVEQRPDMHGHCADAYWMQDCAAYHQRQDAHDADANRAMIGKWQQQSECGA